MSYAIEDKKLARTIGKAARKARKARGLTQEDVADQIGMSAEFYGRIERGNGLPSVQNILRIADSLGVSPNVLFGRAKRSEPSVVMPVEPPSDPPDVRSLIREVRKASPRARRLAKMVLKEVENRR